MTDSQHKEIKELIQSQVTASNAHYRALEDAQNDMAKRMDRIETGLYGDEDIGLKGVIQQAIEAYKFTKKTKGYLKAIGAMITFIGGYIIKKWLE